MQVGQPRRVHMLAAAAQSSVTGPPQRWHRAADHGNCHRFTATLEPGWICENTKRHTPSLLSPHIVIACLLLTRAFQLGPANQHLPPAACTARRQSGARSALSPVDQVTMLRHLVQRSGLQHCILSIPAARFLALIDVSCLAQALSSSACKNAVPAAAHSAASTAACSLGGSQESLKSSQRTPCISTPAVPRVRSLPTPRQAQVSKTTVTRGRLAWRVTCVAADLISNHSIKGILLSLLCLDGACSSDGCSA